MSIVVENGLYESAELAIQREFNGPYLWPLTVKKNTVISKQAGVLTRLGILLRSQGC